MAKRITGFVAIILVIALLGYLAICGLEIGSFKIASVTDKEDGIRRGLDLVGGSSVTFEAKYDDKYDTANLAGDMEIAIAIMRTRLTNAGYTEAEVYQVGEDRLRADVPSVSDPDELIKLLGATAQLTFEDNDGKVYLTGSDIKDAYANYGPISGTGVNVHHVVLELNDAKKFGEVTSAVSKLKENILNVVLDGEKISSPAVNEKIESESAVISGSFDAESAKNLANLIAAGQLPFSLERIELRAVGATLGDRALETSLFAGMIGLLIIMAFMIVYYRLPGFSACISLLFYVAFFAVLMSVLHVNLSLAGIAGILLSIGMAVDANVIIFERIKEELASGKTVRSAINAGFHRATSAIVDSNITTIIAALVLYYLGSGTIQGFALTLGLGIVISMFTAIVMTRALVYIFYGFGLKKPALYAKVKKVEEN